MDRHALIELAQSNAEAFDLDKALVCGLCEQESSWDPLATRFEPAFKKRYIDSLCLSEPEATYRATSYGLMQVMGQVARENGFLANIPSLCEPALGLFYGCKVLAGKLKHHSGDVRAGLLAYNGGGSPGYPDQVMARMAKYQPPAVVVTDPDIM